jgi:23S rRNA (cytidine2498-2'-O)-methyltransferase
MWAVVVPAEFLAQARQEADWKKLERREHKNLFFFEGEPVSFAWSNCVWKDVKTLSITSIADGAKQLRPLARKWFVFSPEHTGRARLIQDQLRGIDETPLGFPAGLPGEGMGVFGLLDKDTVFYSKNFDRPYPSGELRFVEDKSAPSRAYLKAWESISLCEKGPRKAERCVDYGASPGGWTWALVRLGCHVVAADRAPLEKSLMESALVDFRRGDAFSLTPEVLGEVDWIFSDLICYPAKLLEFLRLWIESGKARNFVCTIKLQGDDDPALIAEFEKLGRVLHLFHNKHELTFFRHAAD